MKIKFWGTRGSIAVPGKDTIRYGGNTPCIQLTSNSGETLILDAGTGIKTLGDNLIKLNSTNLNLLITHSHWDHIQGLPFFKPFYSEQYEVNIYASANNGLDVNEIISRQLVSAFFPVTEEIFKSKINIKKISSGDNFNLGDFSISSIAAHHSKGTLSFKIEVDGKTIVYMTDNEIFYSYDDLPEINSITEKNKGLIDFVKDCDYLIHDCMYDVNKYKNKIGWGHSNNFSAAMFAISANVKNLVMFHYNPDYTDSELDKIINNTNALLVSQNSDIKCIPAMEDKIIEL